MNWYCPGEISAGDPTTGQLVIGKEMLVVPRTEKRPLLTLAKLNRNALLVMAALARLNCGVTVVNERMSPGVRPWLLKPTTR